MEQQQSIFDLQLDQPSFGYLSEAAKWARFIAIVGFIFCGLFVVFGLFAGTAMSAIMSSMGGMYSSMGGGILTVVYLLVALLWFFPCLYLFRFASKMREAINTREQERLTMSVKNLKSYFRYVGILLIIVLCFYALAFVVLMVSGIAAMNS